MSLRNPPAETLPLVTGSGTFFGNRVSIDVRVLVPQSCLTLCNSMDCSLPGSSVLGILQAKILERVAISYYRGSSRPRDRTYISCIAGRIFTIRATREAPYQGRVGWDSIQCDQCPYKGEVGDRQATGRVPWEDWRYAAMSQGSTYQAGSGAGGRGRGWDRQTLPGAFRGAWPC